MPPSFYLSSAKFSHVIADMDTALATSLIPGSGEAAALLPSMQETLALCVHRVAHCLIRDETRLSVDLHVGWSEALSGDRRP